MYPTGRIGRFRCDHGGSDGLIGAQARPAWRRTSRRATVAATAPSRPDRAGDAAGPQPYPPPRPAAGRCRPVPAIGLPNLRRNVCPHFYMTGARGAIPIQAPHLLKALMRQDTNVSRCQLRGGVHLEQGYVSDICLSSRFNQCVFYEDELAG